MTSRIYLSASTAGAVTPVANGTWNYTSESVVRAATLAPDNTTNAAGTVIGPWTPGQAARDRVYVTTLKLASNQTINGTITAYAQALEVDSTDNVSTRFEAYVVSQDGQTVRGTLLAIGSHGAGAELNTSMRNIAFASAATVTPVNALANDRLVFVFGYSDTSGTTPEAQALWGGSQVNGIDLPEDETTGTTYNPWVQFSQDLIFELNPTARYDSNNSSSVSLTGSAINSITQIGGSASTSGFSQSTSLNKPAITTVSSKSVMDFTGDADFDYLQSTAGDDAVLYPSVGHYTIMIEYRCTNIAELNEPLRTPYQPNVAVGVFGNANDAGFKFVVGLQYISASVYSFFSSMWTAGFAIHYAETTDLAENVWYLGTSSGRAQMISSQVDARAPTTATLGSTTGVAWPTNASTILLGAGSIVDYAAAYCQIRRIAIFPRYLNPLEAGLARQTYFSSETVYADTFLSVGIG